MRWQPRHPPRTDAPRRERGALFWLTGAMLVAALLFGGASRDNLLQVSALELFSLPLLGMAIARLSARGGWRSAAVPAAIIAAAAAIPLLQLIPLPFELWSKLPGRAAAAEGLRLAGLGSGWRPISVAPLETWRHALALLPPAAVFLAACSLREDDRRWLTTIFPLGAAISLLVGVAQLAGGHDSTLYVYAKTNWGSAVGLFANRNHQAALLVASLPFAALWVDFHRRRERRRALLSLAAAISVFLIEIVALIVVQSRAGILLLAPALLASVLLVWRAQGDVKMGARGALALGGVIVVALAVGFAFGAGPVLQRFAESGDGRLYTAPIVAKAAWANLPFGAGVGSFPLVYASVEPVETMNASFWNHAHNDYLEIWLDAGWPGVAVVLAFLAWWGLRALKAWRSRQAHLARVASVATGLLLVHSVVDYPLRTLALACMFAFACALLTDAPGGRRSSRVSDAR